MLFVVKSHVGWVQTQQVPHLVRHRCAHPLVSPVTEPDLQQAFLGAQRQTQPDDFRLLKLLAYHNNQNIIETLTDERK